MGLLILYSLCPIDGELYNVSRRYKPSVQSTVYDLLFPLHHICRTSACDDDDELKSLMKNFVINNATPLI